MATIYDKGIAYKNFNGDIWYRNFPNNSGTATEPLPGGAGWGCGVYPGDDLEDTLGLIPMEGCDNPNSDNYGNYQNADGSVFCFIPKYYYSFDCKPTDTHYQDVLTYSKLTAEQVAEIVNRSPNNYFVIAPGSAFTNEEEENEYMNKIQKSFVSRLCPYFLVSIIWDTDNEIDLKMSPTDKGKEVFESLYKKRIFI